MNEEWVRCAALLPNGECKNGFPTAPVAACMGSGGVPFCMNETLTARLFPDTGAPRLFDRIRHESRRGAGRD